MKKTPWLNASEHKPIRLGVYEVKFDDCYATWYSHWNGKQWCACAQGPHEAVTLHDKSEWMHEGAVWRGLTASAWIKEMKK